MREIKFRAWEDWDNADTGIDNIKLPKRIINWEEILKWNKASLGNAISGQRGELILMQFTGLKDKNGKEIYEGDIVKCNYCDKDFGIVTWLKDNARFGLNWDVKSCANARHVRIGCWCEVIGNIYENPELLNEMHSTLKK